MVGAAGLEPATFGSAGSGVVPEPRPVALLDAADALIERPHTHAMVPRIAEARAELAALRGDPDRQRAQLRGAHRLYTEMGATGHAERLARELRRPG